MNNLKIAIYAICKNEKQFVDNWILSMIEADYICVLDTGSTDGTYESLLNWQKQYPNKIIIGQKTYKQWRFDVARNDSMELVPQDADILFSTDLDELLIKGWSDEFKNNWTKETTRGIYLFAWNHMENGDPGKAFWYDKAHNRNYKWNFPVHETLLPINKNQKEVVTQLSTKVLLHHYPDLTKSRGSYLSLCKLRIDENPNDFYGRIYYLHELFASKKYRECISFGEKELLPFFWNEQNERMDLMFYPDAHLHIGDSYMCLNNPTAAEYYYRQGIAVFPQGRESYIGLLSVLITQQRYEEAKVQLEQMFSKTKRFNSWLERESSWGYLPYQFASVIYGNLGQIELAKDYAQLALSIYPEGFELQENYKILSNVANNKVVDKELGWNEN